MSTILPSSAVCRGCRYALRDLETNVCPECGVAFDPEDPNTFIVDAQLHRRRRIVRWTAILLVLGVLAFIFCPRGIRRASMTYNFDDGTTMTVKRWEPAPVSWLPIRYPGFHQTTGEATSAPYTIHIAFKSPNGSAGSMTSKVLSGNEKNAFAINGIRASPGNTKAILRDVVETHSISTSFFLVDYHGQSVRYRRSPDAADN